MSKHARRERSAAEAGAGSLPGLDPVPDANPVPENTPSADNAAEDNVFEGAAHVLRGLEQQLGYWESVAGHDAAKEEMVGVLRVSARAVREAVKRAKAADRSGTGRSGAI